MNSRGDGRQVWFITGCSSGIGRAVAEALAQSNAQAVITARRLDSIQQLGAGTDGRILPLELDITDQRSVERALSTAIHRFGGIDLLINNAGVGFVGAIEETSDEEARVVFATNVFGTLNVIRAVMPSMRAQRSGRIITVGSIAGFTGTAGFGIYSGTKFALEGIHEALNVELRPFGISVTILEPGLVATGFRRGVQLSNKILSDYADSVGLVRKGLENNYPAGAADPATIARAILFLAETDKAIPFRLQLGADAVAGVDAKLHSVASELSRWRDFSVSFGGSADVGGIYAELAAKVNPR